MPNVLRELRRHTAAFFADRRGAIAILLGLALIPLVAAVGLAIDSARGYLIKTKLSYAVDSAGLAAASSVGSPDFAAELQKYFDANFPPGYLGATVTGPTFTVSGNGQVISLAASATIDTTFMTVLGHDTLDVSASAEVTRGASNVDLVFSMDLSGSMNNSAGGGQTPVRIHLRLMTFCRFLQCR